MGWQLSRNGGRSWDSRSGNRWTVCAPRFASDSAAWTLLAMRPCLFARNDNDRQPSSPGGPRGSAAGAVCSFGSIAANSAAIDHERICVLVRGRRLELLPRTGGPVPEPTATSAGGFGVRPVLSTRAREIRALLERPAFSAPTRAARLWVPVRARHLSVG